VGSVTGGASDRRAVHAGTYQLRQAEDAGHQGVAVPLAEGYGDHGYARACRSLNLTTLGIETTHVKCSSK
jgi:hypothetical protein